MKSSAEPVTPLSYSITPVPNHFGCRQMDTRYNSSRRAASRVAAPPRGCRRRLRVSWLEERLADLEAYSHCDACRVRSPRIRRIVCRSCCPWWLVLVANGKASLRRRLRRQRRRALASGMGSLGTVPRRLRRRYVAWQSTGIFVLAAHPNRPPLVPPGSRRVPDVVFRHDGDELICWIAGM
jgi:hypothetical protein